MTWLALLLHAALLAAATPLLRGLTTRMAVTWRGELPPPLLQPVHDLRRLWRKSSSLPAAASFLYPAAPIASLATAALAALLVPSFTLAMPLAPTADLIVITALLAASHAAIALAAHESGWAALAHASIAASASRAALAPLLVAIAMVLVLLSGTTNLESAIAAIREGGALPHLAGTLAGLALLAAAAAEPPSPESAFAGRLAALAALAGQLRFATALSAAAALALPFGIAPSGAGPAAWALGVLAWIAKIAALAILAHSIRGWRPLLPAAALLALIAVAIASIQGRA